MLEDMKLPEKALQRCKVRVIGESLPDKDSVLFFGFIDNPEWIAESLAAEFQKRGLDVKANALRKHRNRLCICGDVDA